MGIPTIASIASQNRAAHLEMLAKIRQRPDGSLRSVSVDPAERIRTTVGFDRLELRHTNRPEPWVRYIRPRLEIERVFRGLGINPDPRQPWRNPDGTTVKTSDLVTVIKQVRRSRDPKLVHPQAPTIDDGDIIAVFPTELEKKLRPGKKPIGEATDALDWGALTGNHMAWGKSKQQIAVGRVVTRFYSQAKGAAEGFGDPRMMGRIMCNLGLTSVAISALLYAVMYASNYAETQHALKHEHSRHPPAIQPLAQSGTYTLSA